MLQPRALTIPSAAAVGQVAWRRLLLHPILAPATPHRASGSLLSKAIGRKLYLRRITHRKLLVSVSHFRSLY